MPALGHTWSLSTLENRIFVLARTAVMLTMPPYTFKVVSDDGERVITSLTLTAFGGFNGTVIRCIDTNLDTDEEQTTVAMVLGESV